MSQPPKTMQMCDGGNLNSPGAGIIYLAEEGMVATCLKMPGASARQLKAWVGAFKRGLLGTVTSVLQQEAAVVLEMSQ